MLFFPKVVEGCSAQGGFEPSPGQIQNPRPPLNSPGESEAELRVAEMLARHRRWVAGRVVGNEVKSNQGVGSWGLEGAAVCQPQEAFGF